MGLQSGARPQKAIWLSREHDWPCMAWHCRTHTACHDSLYAVQEPVWVAL